MYKYILFTCIITFWGLHTQAQDTTYHTVHLKEDPTIQSYYSSLKTTTNAVSSTTSTTGHKSKGFRIQIYNGNSHTEASRIKMQFIKAYPGVRSYIKFNNPQYRVRIGDFMTRAEAEAYQKKIQGSFRPTMIIPDLVNTPQN